MFLWYTTDFNMIAAYLSVIEAAGNMPQTRDCPSSSSDNQRKLVAMQNTMDDHAAMSESANFATSTLSIEHFVIWNWGSAITIWLLNVRMWELNWLIRTLAGNVGKCVCRLHPSNDRHFCLSPTCRKCRPDTSATFCYVGHFFGCRRCVGETCCWHTFHMYIGISRVLVRGWCM